MAHGRLCKPCAIIAPMHVLLLRLALGLYSVGFAHAALTALLRKQTFFRPALAAVSAGFVVHALSIALRALEVHYLPLTQQYETFSFFGALAALGFLIAYAKYRIAPLSVFAFPLIFVMTFIANLVYDPSSSIPPVLRSNWIYIHTPVVFLGYAALFIAFAAAIMYLIQEHALKSKHPVRFYNWLPSLEICDDLAYRSLAIGFPLITLGIITGALWAQGAGVVWAKDAKVVFSFLTWLVYLLLIVYRLIAGWRGRKAAYLYIVGFIGILVTFLGADYFGGLHTFN
jgi:cytochrome c-type biogenesis protein CcsB